ncbi:DgyrCDS7780 [Dimorphilus gyrociliatus]|uniref:DgyrCDS7780 n=1 Tax=Dimorphilus gyrociliatus TaxID=2664684 RepID=A0A7I8VSA2_9ANNE|nr:DgyrCDS7780 [Dimorphilus gyrociliatus]
MNENSDKASEEQLKLITEKVNKVGIFRDDYLLNHPIEEANLKEERVRTLVEKTLDELKEYETLFGNDPLFLLEKGKLLNKHPEISDECEKVLTKVVKLRPEIVEGWSELGECLFKLRKFDVSMTCFQKAVEKDLTHTPSLRHYSMLLRQVKYKEPEDKDKAIRESIDWAKRAVARDVKDGFSWLTLANAYTAMFFATLDNDQILKQIFTAYEKAAADDRTVMCPDLHYNKGSILMYEERFQEAVDSFNQAVRLEPSWQQAEVNAKNIVTYVDTISEFLGKKGKLKQRQIDKIMKSFKLSTDLGEYSKNITTPAGETIKLKYQKFNELNVGRNENIVIMGKVISTIANENFLNFTACLIDENGDCICVTIYNRKMSWGPKIGDSVAIPDPFVSEISLKTNDKEYNYRNIRVDCPLILLVNGRKVGRENYLSSSISFDVKD